MTSMPINLRRMIEKLYHERYMGVLIYCEADCGKTRYVKKFMKMEHELRILYVDVQETLSNQGDREIVFELTPKKFLEQWCLPLIDKEKYNAIILDNFDVIVNLWDTRKKTELITRIRKTEKAVYSIPVIAILQEDSLFDEAYLQQNETVLQRIIRFSELEKL